MCLHEDHPEQEVKARLSTIMENSNEGGEYSASQELPIKTISNRVRQDNHSVQTSTIVPVYVSSDSDKEVLVYALLDSQNDYSFILKEVADTLEVDAEPVKLKLSTMSS